MKFSMLVAALPFLACSPDDDKPVTTSARLSAAICDFGLRCVPYDMGESGVIAALRTVSPGQCEDFAARYIFGDAPAGTKADEAALDACIASAKASCDVDALFDCRADEGEVALGAACKTSSDCVGDAYCSSECDGVCTARVAVGTACESDDACAGPDTKCNYESNTCMKVTRTKNVAAGGACGELHTDATLTIAACAAGLACYDDACVAVAAQGGDCIDDHSPCAIGLVCMPDAEGEAACSPQPFTLKAGDACESDPDYVQGMTYCNIATNLGCIAGKCEQLGDGTNGSRCVDFDLPHTCNDGLECDDATNRCVPLELDICTQ